jgi:hypothetical protein
LDRTNNTFLFSIILSVAPESDEEWSSDEEEEDSDTKETKETEKQKETRTKEDTNPDVNRKENVYIEKDEVQKTKTFLAEKEDEETQQNKGQQNERKEKEAKQEQTKSNKEKQSSQYTIENKEDSKKYILLLACSVVFVAVFVAWLFNG